jgi:hypothetical protein
MGVGPLKVPRRESFVSLGSALLSSMNSSASPSLCHVEEPSLFSFGSLLPSTASKEIPEKNRFIENARETAGTSAFARNPFTNSNSRPLLKGTKFFMMALMSRTREPLTLLFVASSLSHQYGSFKQGAAGSFVLS